MDQNQRKAFDRLGRQGCRRGTVAHLISFLLVAPISLADHPVPSLDDRNAIVLIGDSITDNLVADASDFYGYANTLERNMTDWKVTGAGLGGATSRDWDPNDYNEDDLHFIIQGRELFTNVPATDVAFVYLGTNDAIGFFEEHIISPGDYGAYMQDIVNTLLRRGVDHVLVGVLQCPDDWVGTGAEGRFSAYNEELERVCDATRPGKSAERGGRRTGRHRTTHPSRRYRYQTCSLIDFDFSPEDGAWVGGIHPSRAGHAKMAELVEAAARELLPLGVHEQTAPISSQAKSIPRVRPKVVRGARSWRLAIVGRDHESRSRQMVTQRSGARRLVPMAIEPDHYQSAETLDGIRSKFLENLSRVRRVVEDRSGCTAKRFAAHEHCHGKAVSHQLIPPTAVRACIDPIGLAIVVDRNAATAGQR